MTKMHDVIVVGAGFSGLVCCKHALENDLSVLVLEKQEDLGGIWNYSPDPDRPSVYKSTITTSSRIVSEISDFPMPDDYPDFPHHSQMLDYFKSYADHFSLLPHIRFNSNITNIQKNNGLWFVSTSDGINYQSKHLVMCTGVHQTPNDIRDQDPFDNFNGTIMHSSQYRYADSDYHDKRILVYGGGESASDICHELSLSSRHVYWCIPNGQWFIDRKNGVAPLDYLSNRFQEFFYPPSAKNKLFARELNKSWLNGFNIAEFQSQAPHSRAFFTKNVEVYQDINLGRITPVSRIESINDKCVVMEKMDKKTKDTYHVDSHIDLIVLATGFKKTFPMLPEQYQSSTYDLHHFIFCKNDPTLAFVGFVRPTFGSIFGIAEMQARLVMHRMTHPIELSDHQIQATIDSDKKHYMEMFQYTSKRLDGLVEHMYYTDELAKQCGCYPNWKQLIRHSPKKSWQLFLGPLHGCQYLVNQSHYHDYIFNTIYKKYKHQFHPSINPYIHVSSWCIFRFIVYSLRKKCMAFFIFDLPRMFGRYNDR